MRTPPDPPVAPSRRALLLACAGWGAASALPGCGGGDGDGDGLGALPPPGTGAIYALQAGRFASRPVADQLAARVHTLGGTGTVVTTVDESGVEWYVAAIGRFSSLDEARSQRSHWANLLGLLPDDLVPIQLPPSLPNNQASE